MPKAGWRVAARLAHLGHGAPDEAARQWEMTMLYVEYRDGHGFTPTAQVIGTHGQNGRLWVAVWETIRDEPSWISPDNVMRVFIMEAAR